MSRSEKVVATKQFAEDFETVAAHYRLKDLGEYDEAKQVARNDMAAAQVSFAAMAQEIKTKGVAA